MCRQRKIKAVFCRVSEFKTSQLCPRLACRHGGVGARQPTQVAHNLGDFSYDNTRAAHCPKCHKSYNRDVAAAENIAFVCWHTLVYGVHPFGPVVFTHPTT